MCYAALVSADLRRLERDFGSKIDLAAFLQLFQARISEPKAFKLPLALDRAFLAMKEEGVSQIVAAIMEHRQQRTTEWEAEIFEQRRRYADAQRKLTKRTTKAALHDLRVSADKVEQRLKWLADFRDEASTDEDTVMYSKNYGALMIQTEVGRRLMPMRYLCRLPGHSPEMDKELSGNYNARIDKLEGFWRPLFSRSHGIMIVRGFRENVQLHDLENRPLQPGERAENVVLQFNPSDGSEMLLPCIWARWQKGEEVLNSMALITDEPPDEVARAGHNRCPINLTREAALAWLAPQGRSSAELFEILSQRHRPYYEHRVAEAA